MTKKRRQYSPEFKFKVALEAVKAGRLLASWRASYRCIPRRSVTGSACSWKKVLASSGGTGLTFSASTKPCKPNSSSKSAASRWSWSG